MFACLACMQHTWGAHSWMSWHGEFLAQSGDYCWSVRDTGFESTGGWHARVSSATIIILFVHEKDLVGLVSNRHIIVHGMTIP